VSNCRFQGRHESLFIDGTHVLKVVIEIILLLLEGEAGDAATLNTAAVELNEARMGVLRDDLKGVEFIEIRAGWTERWRYSCAEIIWHVD
jgi:hypothetical protein